MTMPEVAASVRDDVERTPAHATKTPSPSKQKIKTPGAFGRCGRRGRECISTASICRASAGVLRRAGSTTAANTLASGSRGQRAWAEAVVAAGDKEKGSECAGKAGEVSWMKVPAVKA